VLVGDWSENALDEEFGAGLDVFLVAGRAEPAGFAGEGKGCVEAAVVTADAGKIAFKGAAVEEFVDDLRDGGTQRAAKWGRFALRSGSVSGGVL
jgi:hypothetical protein